MVYLYDPELQVMTILYSSIVGFQIEFDFFIYPL
jgi:hypothetical protein